MFKLGVNVDHVATVRQARGGVEPDPVRAALVCQRAGADAIVMHLREDRRHIQDKDVFRAKDSLAIKFNLEMSLSPGIVKIAEKVRPGQVTMVPERRMERTTEGGLDVVANDAKLRRCLDRFKSRGILVSLFIDPDERQVERSMRLGADAVEFHTGDYAAARPGSAREREFGRLGRAVAFARAGGLAAHAGHGLDYDNVAMLKRLRGLDELNIGYSIVTQAVWVGLDRAVRQMKAALR